MSTVPQLNTELSNLPPLAGLHMPQSSALPVQSSVGQQCPQPYQAPPHQIQQQYTYQNSAQNPLINPLSAPFTTAPNYTIVNAEKPSLEEADRQPWRYRGYPAMCRWMASDNDFCVIRRFGEVATRVLLRMQDHIVRLEGELREQDRISTRNVQDNGTFRYEENCLRNKILDDLSWRLSQYQRFVLDHSQLKARTEATEFQISNVKRWIEGANKKVIRKEEQEFLDVDGDLIPVVPKAKTPLRRFIDRFDILRLPTCFRERKKNERLYAADDFEITTTVYNKDSVVDKFVTCTTILLGLGMVIGPLWWLQFVSSSNVLKTRLEVITGFLIVFTILLSTLTVAKPFEVLAATAAYGAVLMVFMQLGSNAGGK